MQHLIKLANIPEFVRAQWIQDENWIIANALVKQEHGYVCLVSLPAWRYVLACVQVFVVNKIYRCNIVIEKIY